ncbi:MAG: AAA family ATPase [Bdellovibrionaceae bacterium]|nr:AAA family ATPase [Pseudobdellovibrionaceae bacterium]
MYSRLLDLRKQIARKSVLLLGPRQTGKSTYLKSTFPDAHLVDLLRYDTFQFLLKSPGRLEEIVALQKAKTSTFIIDEIQKVPALLDEVHRLIESDKKLRFILTGSSARKLRRSGANLLGGRATFSRFHPIVFPELASGRHNKRRTWKDCLTIGALPSILESDEPAADLQDYVGVYLREEIQAEGLARSVEAFSRFLEIAAQSCAEQVNFTSIGSDAQVPPRTVIDYFTILEDTLVGYLLPAYTKTKKRKAMASAKFYWFDVGVGNALLGKTNIREGTEDFGKALEHYVFTQLRAFLDYNQMQLSLSYWRSLSKFEVDFVIPLSPATAENKAIAIEVKATRNPTERAFKGILALEEDLKLEKKILVAPVPSSYKTEHGIEVLHPEDFFDQLWSGRIIERA